MKFLETGEKIAVIESCSVGCSKEMIAVGRCHRGEGRNDWEMEREEPEAWGKKELRIEEEVQEFDRGRRAVTWRE